MIVKKQSPSPVLHLSHLYVLGFHHHLLILLYQTSSSKGTQGAIGYLPGLSKAQSIHRQGPQPPWTAGSHSRLAGGLWHGNLCLGYPCAGGLYRRTETSESGSFGCQLDGSSESCTPHLVRGSCSWGKNLDEVYWPCSPSRAMPSFPSQLEWKIGLAWANTRGILNSPS